MYIELVAIRRAIEFRKLIFNAKSKDHKQKSFQTDYMEIRYEI